MVIERELRVAARRSESYWTRVIAGACGTVALLGSKGAVANGRDLFFMAVVFSFIVCVVEGVRRAAAAIASEKNDGTLGL